MNFNFGEVLTRAWQIIWKHKVLWVFGVLASCGRGGGSGSGSSGNQVSSGQSPFPELEQNMERFAQWISENLWVVAVVVLVSLVIALLFIFLGTIGRIGLIKGTYRADLGAEQLVLGELFSESMPYFWRVFGLSFLIGLVFLIILIPLVLFGVLTAGVGFLCLIPLICLMIPIGLVVSVIVEQANAAIVLEDLGIKDGLMRGWEVVKSNIGAVILMAIILIVIGAVVGFVVALPLLLVVVPAAIAFAVGDGQTTTPLAFIGICICLYLPIAIVLQGIMVSYIQSAWTLTYMRLTRKPDTDIQPIVDNIPTPPPPVEPMDSEKTLIAREPKDDNQTFIAKKPDA